MADLNSPAQIELARIRQRDNSEDQQATMGNVLSQGNGGNTGSDFNSMAPGYGGVMPKRDFGFEQFLSHNLGTFRYRSGGDIHDGPYAGLSKDQAIEKMHDDYRKMSPEQRAPFEARRFNQDVRSPEEMKNQGFQYDDQTKQWGSKGNLNSSVYSPQYKIGQDSLPLSPQTFSQSVGDMTPDQGGGASHHSTDDLLTHVGSVPQYPDQNAPIPTGTVSPRDSDYYSNMARPTESPARRGVPGANGKIPSSNDAPTNLMGDVPARPVPSVSGGTITSNSSAPEGSRRPVPSTSGGSITAQPTSVVAHPDMDLVNSKNTTRYGLPLTGSGPLNQVITNAQNKEADARMASASTSAAVAPAYAAPASSMAQNPNVPIGTVANTTLPNIADGPSSPSVVASTPAKASAPVQLPVSAAQQTGQAVAAAPGQALSNLKAGAGAVATNIAQTAAPAIEGLGNAAESAEEIARKKAAALAAAGGKAYDAVATPASNAVASTITGVSDFTKGLQQGWNKNAPTYADSSVPPPASIPNAPPAYASVGR